MYQQQYAWDFLQDITEYEGDALNTLDVLSAVGKDLFASYSYSFSFSCDMEPYHFDDGYSFDYAGYVTEQASISDSVHYEIHTHLGMYGKEMQLLIIALSAVGGVIVISTISFFIWRACAKRARDGKPLLGSYGQSSFYYNN